MAIAGTVVAGRGEDAIARESFRDGVEAGSANELVEDPSDDRGGLGVGLQHMQALADRRLGRVRVACVAMDDYPNTAQVVCANVVLRDDHLLLVRESKRSALGRWSLPAGRLEVGESLRDGAAREALEETGLTVEVGALLGIYHCPTSLEGGAAVHFVFRSDVSGGAVRTSAEQPEVAFVSRREVDDLLDKNLIRGQHVRLALEAADAGAALPADLVQEVGPSPSPTP